MKVKPSKPLSVGLKHLKVLNQQIYARSLVLINVRQPFHFANRTHSMAF